MILLVGFFDWSDHFDQMLNNIYSQEGQFFKMIHQNANGLIKLAILIWLASLLGMFIKLPTYLLTQTHTYLFN
jgi:hypothetical protein